ncbi:FHA domain-containing protein [Streptomyces mangrovisoli]|uniref:Phosphopeptide-binding protein n=1 Tax=Streptomyces mangrovisoli TaxID=1428628 RepID=A0A1J4P464_9ACTN|nr:FHA domain-containing protein [Streptomyces mangrovisoli]OIJ69387.1 phosphopeptide-binding protein [Streptomyces mangrovisoli]
MPTCPNGHQSGSDDWCEVCGHRMAGAVPPPPPPPPAGGYGFPPPQGGRGGGRGVPAAEPELCPQCRTPREGGAPFCEECRWNFLTNTATSYTPAAPRNAAPSPASRFQQPPGPTYGGDPYEYQGSRPSQMNRPAEPLPPFTSEPSGPTPFGGGQQQGPGGHQGQGPGGHQGPGQQGMGGGQQGMGGGRPGMGGQQGMGGPQGPGGYPGQGGPGGQGGPSNFGPDPSRPVPPPPGPTPNAGPNGPQAFQPGPQAPPAFPQETGRPPRQGGPSFGGGEDDWVISPPGGPGGQGGPGQGGPVQGGGYSYPPAGGTQAPPTQGYAQAPRPPAGWTATIGPDRDYFLAMMQRSGPEATGLNLPAYSPEQQRTLSGNQITIGRRRHSTGDTPDIDLSVPPEDPGVSHQHAVLVQQPDGNWAVVDQNSTNGTTVNGSEEPIQPFVPVPLQDGDRVHVGAWTTITIRRG